jgi:holliday junction DNA helicase RuvA
MIRMIRGTAIARGKDHVVIDVGGLAAGFGVKVFVPESAAAETALNTAVTLHTYLQVREDALNLYGFRTEDELSIFELLLGVSGVGPKVALATLSALTPDSIRLALANDEPALISRVPGIGKRTAQKIVLELRDKVQPPGDLAQLAVAVDADADVIEALTSLGYSVVEAQRAVQQIPGDVESVEDRLRIAPSKFNAV